MQSTTFTAVLRRAILEFDGSHNDLARLTKVPQPTITRFINGADMKLNTADRLAFHLGVYAQQRRPRGKPAK
jgi:hypothetical protein